MIIQYKYYISKVSVIAISKGKKERQTDTDIELVVEWVASKNILSIRENNQ